MLFFKNPHSKGLGHTVTEYENKSKDLVIFCFGFELSFGLCFVFGCSTPGISKNGSIQFKLLPVFWKKKAEYI